MWYLENIYKEKKMGKRVFKVGTTFELPTIFDYISCIPTLNIAIRYLH